MRLLLFFSLQLLLGISLASSLPFCHFTGCAPGGECRCVDFLMYCDVDQCRFTGWGIALMVVGSIFVLSALVAIFRFFRCCYKLWRCLCCGGGGHHKHVHYHNGKSGNNVIQLEGDDDDDLL